ncbi:2-hydroxycyclohexanecarboxyl-CoA dehydrogenase [Rhodococcus opacus PD630]|uniref:SDR family NAD(P)-dependent oxidoreductase n=1 Tax=Rhodococcus opacus TaxID=37919 RepID=UPI00029CB8AC|nr:SDR family NAD(P)-dependent oxidoreductase [Rhodococcus opacus]AHK28627.1 putative oxidoreductase [Rhodococcus opacus PD630]EHI44315.1 2-hydroxycyclohexanecarboxyl-CoA dehydrogenase [Rhodococcus opacus PD630]UDG98494.1 SDR family NAD(P)-dependent oxidoreductase [Rhodococcus opacus PD630]
MTEPETQEKQVVVVTGAASGIGAGIARHAHARGMAVILADIDTAALDRLAADLGGAALTCATDVADSGSVHALADLAYDSFGRVDLLFNNAGIMRAGFLWQLGESDWDATLGVNVTGVVNGIRAFVPRMIDQGGGGRVVNTASVGGFAPGPMMSPYSASKFAVVAITECLQMELSMVGAPVSASVLAPGPVITSVFDNPFGTVSHPAVDRMVAQMRDLLGTDGLDADTFAALVFAGIDRGDFWLAPQGEHLDSMVRQHTATILERREPAIRQSFR